MNFFGLQPSDRYNIFKQVHEIVFHGKGGYDWWTVYNLPISHKKFIYLQISEHYRKEQEAANGNKLVNDDQSKILRPPTVAKNSPKTTNSSKPAAYSTKLAKK